MSEVKTVIGLVLGVFLIILLIALWPLVGIGAGERGVVFNRFSGIENRVLGEGTHLRIPLVESVKVVSVRTLRTDIGDPKEPIQTGSKDLQTIKMVIAINWRLKPDLVHRAYQSLGDMDTIINNVLTPNAIEAIKASASQRTAEETLTKREELKADIDERLRERLSQYKYIIVDTVSIVDADFSEQFNAAIERKATAEQNALAEKNKLEQVKYEAQQKIENAKADAESIRIQGEALKFNQELVGLKAVEKWNGVLPVNMYGSAPLPFLNIK